MSKRRYWLMKSEPDVFGIDDLMAAKDQTTHWEGVRNYQARNYMRNDMQIGDGVLFYHSNAKPLAIVGTMNVSSEPIQIRLNSIQNLIILTRKVLKKIHVGSWLI